MSKVYKGNASYLRQVVEGLIRYAGLSHPLHLLFVDWKHGMTKDGV